MFTSAATGLACGVAFIRGIGGRELMGNFYVDLTRAMTRLLIPAALVFGFVMVGLGLPATFSGSKTVSTLNGPLTPAAASASSSGGGGGSGVTDVNAPAQQAAQATDTAAGQQVIARGPVAAMEPIKELGTNGGGFFNVNSAHPFENPSGFTNALEIIMMGTIPIAIIFMMGAMLKRMKMAIIFFAVMGLMFIGFMGFTYGAEKYGNPLLTDQGVSHSQGNMEGKEQRFGQGETAIFVTATTAFTTGSVDAMHDSLTPLGSVTPFTQMFLQMVYGGKGVGFITFIVFVIITIFLAGLMVGRTPQFLGKKLEAHETRLAAFAFLLHPALILIPLGITLGLRLDLQSIPNAGPHGFSEVLYAFSSASANNGSAFGGLTGNTNWYNGSLAIVAMIGRYGPIILMLALAGSLAAKKPTPEGVGTLSVETPLFAAVLTGVILIVIVLTFFPVLAIGPFYEHFQMMARHTF
jgi:K+-transporting ATPase ATPase A chain